MEFVSGDRQKITLTMTSEEFQKVARCVYYINANYEFLDEVRLGFSEKEAGDIYQEFENLMIIRRSSGSK